MTQDFARLVDDLFRLITQFMHVFAAILWIGGGFYNTGSDDGSIVNLSVHQNA